MHSAIVRAPSNGTPSKGKKPRGPPERDHIYRFLGGIESDLVALVPGMQLGLALLHVFDQLAVWDIVAVLAIGAQVVGEIGLDKWIEGYDLELQQAAFHWQLAQATTRNLPTSIHCLKAIGPLMETLRAAALPARGIHLHAYNGPVELIPELVELGTYFSFNAGQLKAGKSNVPERIRAVPDERLLIETDAPDMLPPPELRAFELPQAGNERTLTHPATLKCGYQAIATLRGSLLESLTEQVALNFQTYFLS